MPRYWLGRGGRCDRNTPGRWWRGLPPRRTNGPAGCRRDRLASRWSKVRSSRIHVALKTDCERPRRIRIDPEARLAEVEIVLRVRTAHQLVRVLESDFRVGAIRAARAEAAAVTNGIGPSTLDPAETLANVPLGVGRALGDDVDDAVDRVRAPDAPPGPRMTSMRSMSGAHVLRLPEHAREDRRVDRAPVDQDEQLVRRADGEPARADAVLRARDLRDVQVAGQAQRLRPGS